MHATMGNATFLRVEPAFGVKILVQQSVAQ